MQTQGLSSEIEIRVSMQQRERTSRSRKMQTILDMVVTILRVYYRRIPSKVEAIYSLTTSNRRTSSS